MMTDNNVDGTRGLTPCGDAHTLLKKFLRKVWTLAYAAAFRVVDELFYMHQANPTEPLRYSFRLTLKRVPLKTTARPQLTDAFVSVARATPVPFTASRGEGGGRVKEGVMRPVRWCGPWP